MRPSVGALLPRPSSCTSSPSASMPVKVIGIWTFWPAATCASTSDGVGAALLEASFWCTLMVIVADAALPRLSLTVYVTGKDPVWSDAWYRTVLPDTNTSPLNVFLSYCRSFCRLTVVPSE